MNVLLDDIIKRGKLINEYCIKSQYDDGYPKTYKVKTYQYVVYMIEILYENNIIVDVHIKAI